jgi:hypothetical protein
LKGLNPAPIRQEKLSCTGLRGLGADKSPWLSGLFSIEKSPKMLGGYGQKDDKVFGKIGLLWQEN